MPRVDVEGLLLEGGCFDRRSGLVVEANAQSANVTSLPMLTLAWCPSSEAGELHNDDQLPRRPNSVGFNYETVEIPLYASLQRDKILCSVWVPTDNRCRRIFNATAIFLTQE